MFIRGAFIHWAPLVLGNEYSMFSIRRNTDFNVSLLFPETVIGEIRRSSLRNPDAPSEFQHDTRSRGLSSRPFVPYFHSNLIPESSVTLSFFLSYQ
jgi:hypothetical protein